MSKRAAHYHGRNGLPPGSAARQAVGVNPPEDRLLTQREVARLLGVSPSYIRVSSCPKYLLPGNGPRGRPLLRYRLSEVLAWARGDLDGSPSQRQHP